MQKAEVVLSVLRERGRRGLPLTQLYRQMFNKDLYLLFVDRTTGRHQRKREFVKRYGEIFLLLVLLAMAWRFLLRVMPVSAGAWFGA